MRSTSDNITCSVLNVARVIYFQFEVLDASVSKRCVRIRAPMDEFEKALEDLAAADAAAKGREEKKNENKEGGS